MMTLLARQRATGELAQSPVDGSVRIELNRRKLLLQAIAGLATIVGGIVAIVLVLMHLDPFSAQSWPDPTHLTDSFRAPQWAHAGGAGIAVLAGIFAWLRTVARLQDGDAALVVSPRGLLNNSDAPGREIGLVPWTAIERLQTRRFKHNRFIVVRLRDPGRWMSSPGVFGSLRQRVRAHVVGSPLTIRTNLLQAKAQDIEKLLERYLAQYGRQ